ncbi:MAG: DinB family protein [Chitinophagaceae bacterium]
METTPLDLVIKMTLTAWSAQNNQLNKLVDHLTEAELARQVAPGKNSGLYLYGHLVAVSDGMLPVMGWGELLFPDLAPVFINSPDRAGHSFPDLATLKACNGTIHARLNEHFQSTPPAAWFSRHMSVSPEDFVKEPHRNKLNIVISRTNHLAYHLGQLQLLKQ